MEGRLLLPLPFHFEVFPDEKAVEKSDCSLCTTPLATSSQGTYKALNKSKPGGLG